MTHSPHLTEEERQTLADGTMPDSRTRELAAHLRECDACAADVARLERLLATANGAGRQPSAPSDDLWPSIRSRIEQQKIVTLGAPSPASRQKYANRLVGGGIAVAAAVVVIVAVLSARRQAPQPASGLATSGGSPVELVAVDDSVRSYEAEAQILLDRLELERSIIRPEAMAPIDHDLAVIDRAIAELRAAIAEDPRNPALRRLLAASYRQKVDVLKRARNAG